VASGRSLQCFTSVSPAADGEDKALRFLASSTQLRFPAMNNPFHETEMSGFYTNFHFEIKTPNDLKK